MPSCEVLPDGPRPQKSMGRDVKFRYAKLNLCPLCEMTKRKQDDAFISKSLIKFYFLDLFFVLHCIQQPGSYCDR